MALRRKLPPTNMKASAKTLAFRLCSDQRFLGALPIPCLGPSSLLARFAPTALFVKQVFPTDS
jgi:hypothetical protein